MTERYSMTMLKNRILMETYVDMVHRAQ